MWVWVGVEVAMASGSNGAVIVDGAGSGHGAPLVSQGSGTQPARGTASKYDFVKVCATLYATSSQTRISLLCPQSASGSACNFCIRFHRKRSTGASRIA